MKIEDYDRAITSFCKANQELTIYQAGEVSEPGYSDLDFVVFADSAPVVPADVQPFLMGGNVILQPSEYASEINLLERFTLRHLQGTEYKFVECPEPYMTIVEIFEWLPERILKLEQLLHKSDIASAHLVHKSLNRSISKVSNFANKEYDMISSRVFRLELSEKQQRQVLEHQIKTAKSCWRDFELTLADRKFIVPHTGVANTAVEICDYYRFKNEYSTLASYFSQMSTANDSMLSKKVANCISGAKRIQFEMNLQQFLFNRWNLLCKVHDWFVRNKVRKGMIKYGWLL